MRAALRVFFSLREYVATHSNSNNNNSNSNSNS